MQEVLQHYICQGSRPVAVVLASTRDTAHQMSKIYEFFTTEKNINFSTNPYPRKTKSKVPFVVGAWGGELHQPAPVVLCGRPLPWVKRAEHLIYTFIKTSRCARTAEKRCLNSLILQGSYMKCCLLHIPEIIYLPLKSIALHCIAAIFWTCQV